MRSEKARENIRAAGVLQRERLPSSAASRAYYAAYLAAWDWLDRYVGPDKRAEDGTPYWGHTTLPETLNQEGALDPKQEHQFERLRAARICADYYPHEVNVERATEAVTIANELLDLLTEHRGVTR